MLGKSDIQPFLGHYMNHTYCRDKVGRDRSSLPCVEAVVIERAMLILESLLAPWIPPRLIYGTVANRNTASIQNDGNGNGHYHYQHAVNKLLAW